MREIKFRAFDSDPETMKMIYSDKPHSRDYWFTADDGVVQCLINCCYRDSFGDEHDDWSPLDNIMQCTGLKDKNGKEIYEGDIVKCVRVGDVIWSELVVVEDIREFPRPVYGSNLVSKEVIGNIYENPELLKGEEHETY